jgi:hypothetical protein
MIRLLETEYFERLFSRKNLADEYVFLLAALNHVFTCVWYGMVLNDSPVDLLAQFFCSLISKDYNLDLIRAVCEKIVHLGMDDGLLVAPLTALIKKGSLYAKIHAFRALTALAIKRKSAIYDSGTLPNDIDAHLMLSYITLADVTDTYSIYHRWLGFSSVAYLCIKECCIITSVL